MNPPHPRILPDPRCCVFQADANVPVMHAAVINGRAPPFMSSLMPAQPSAQAGAPLIARQPFPEGPEAGRQEEDAVAGSLGRVIQMQV
jgi:hypothetical protein